MTKPSIPRLNLEKITAQQLQLHQQQANLQNHSASLSSSSSPNHRHNKVSGSNNSSANSSPSYNNSRKSPSSSPSNNSNSRKSPVLRNVNFPYILGSLIGRGNFGDVYFGMNANSGENLAIKQIFRNRNNTRNNEVALQSFLREVELVSKLRHPHVVGYLGIAISPNSFSIFMEYCSGGSLSNMLR